MTEKNGSAVQPAEPNGTISTWNTEMVPGITADTEKKDSNPEDGSKKQEETKTVGAIELENTEESSEPKEEKTVGAFEVFRFSTWLDRLLMFIGTLAACGTGVALPLLIVVFGEMTDTFTSNGQYLSILDTIVAYLSANSLTKSQCISNPSVLSPHIPTIKANYTTVDTTIIQKQIDQNFMDEIEKFAIYFTIIGCAAIFLSYLQVSCWSMAAERQAHRIRKLFFQSILKQEVGWFDTHETGQLNNRLSQDINQIHVGIGDKLGNFFQWFAAFLAGFIIGFIYGWKLTLVILSVSPLMVVAMAAFGTMLTSMTSKELTAYAKSGAIAEETISSIRTVVAFGGQDKACERYNKNLKDALNYGIKKAISNGLAMGSIYLVMFLAYALGFWYGAKLTREDNYTIGDMIIVFISVLIGAIALGTAAPNLADYMKARAAAYPVFEIISREPSIDSSSSEGETPTTLEGNISFKNIHFQYPAREEIKVLDGVNLEVRKGQTVALVGASGCGKSTMIQLMQRLYDPVEGQVEIDGKNIKDLNVNWLRNHIGIVSQEPVLFAASIEENILFGVEGKTKDDVIEAAKMANAHNFISDLPEKYDTMVGEKGAQLSGGQKQRVAIARALLRDPRILLLDEATSALDTESEVIVQEALEKASAGRTTIVVAHRLSTIKTADIIAGFKKGVIVEQGTHDQLMQKSGVYSELVKQQTQIPLDKEDEELIKEYVAAEKHVTPQKSQKSVANAVVDSEEAETQKKEEEEHKGSFKRIIRLSSPEWYFILLGCIACIFVGAVNPVFAVLFSKVIGIFGSTDTEYQKREIAKYSLGMVGTAVGSFVFIVLQHYSFGQVGEHLTLRLRKMAFKALLRQDIAFFDHPKHSTGALTTRLATEASEVHGASGARLGTSLQALANMGTALVISFIYGWKLTFVILAFIPLMAIAGFVNMQILAGVAGKNKEALESSGKIATEAIGNIRTVQGLSLEKPLYKMYCRSLHSPHISAMRKSHMNGIAFGFSQGIMYFAYATGFYVGGYFVQREEMDFEAVFIVFSAVVFGAMALGEASSFAPDAGKAQVSAAHIFELLDTQPKIDSYSEDGEKLDSYKSVIHFKNTDFSYPNRLDVQVLKSLSLTIEPGQTVALVGASGCGKSTTMQLIERFYDPDAGNVELSGHDIKALNIQWLRAQIGIVSQEPVLFDCSIAENIAYGDNSRVVLMDEIISAARSANIHNFVASLPNGYDTNVGSKGTQLSGGQKQRVAIARALLRNPKILLLDEATSALDTESEKIVQEALDKAREGRTCIVIAHRLSTIRNADKICVIKHGEVVEEGRHGDLMSKKGIYFKLNTAQVSPI